jgi:hypothetical protein
MMGGFFIRFVRYLSVEEFAKLLQLARARTFKVVKNNDDSASDSVVMWLLIGRHWIAGVSIGYRVEGETEYISLCLPKAIEENNKICIDSEEKQLEPKYVFDYKTCHHIEVRVTSEDRDGYRYAVRYMCHEVERKAVFAVEINTNQPEQHDDFILQLVAEELASESPRTVLRPM